MSRALVILLLVIVPVAAAAEPESEDSRVVTQLRELEPLPKVHYSWPLPFDKLSDSLLYEYARLTREEAQQKHLQFRHLRGDLGLLRAMLSGEWNDYDFLVVQPGQELAGEDDGQILTVVNIAQ